MTTSPEANAVAFFSFKRTDGYEVSLTLRSDSGTEALAAIDKAIEAVKAQGAVPVVKPMYGKAPVTKEYADYQCPLCGEKVVKGTTKNGKKFEKCETQKFFNNQVQGCTYTKWINEGGNL